MIRNSDNNVYQTTDPYTDYSNYIDNTTVKTFGSEIMQTLNYRMTKMIEDGIIVGFIVHINSKILGKVEA